MTDHCQVAAECEVINRLGLHARAAGTVVKAANRFECEVTIAFDGQNANAKSILALMTLAAVKGSVVRVEAVGPDAEHALGTILQLFAERFGEDD